MKRIIYIILFSSFVCANLFAQEQEEIKEIKNILKVFQTGYTERDTSKVLDWCEKLFYDNIEIIGTYSIKSGSREWQSGMENAVRAFRGDWLGWGDLESNIEDANIGVDNDLAWISFEATIKRNPENSRGRTADESFGNILKHISDEIVTKKDIPNKNKILEIGYYTSLLLYQYGLGEEFIWPIRISGVLQKKENEWKFRQMHFSHPNRGFPNVRY